MVSDLLHPLGTCKSTGPDGVHPRVLRELAAVLTEPRSSTDQQSWLTGEVPVDWRLPNMTPIYKNDQEEDQGKYRLVSLTLVLEKVLEWITFVSHSILLGNWLLKAWMGALFAG